MASVKTTWLGMGESGRRFARRAIAYCMTVLLCFTAHGITASFSVLPLTLLGTEDDTERASDETARETVSKLFRLRFSCPKHRHIVQGRLPVPGAFPHPRALQPPTSLAVHRLGAGIAIRC